MAIPVTPVVDLVVCVVFHVCTVNNGYTTQRMKLCPDNQYVQPEQKCPDKAKPQEQQATPAPVATEPVPTENGSPPDPQ